MNVTKDNERLRQCMPGGAITGRMVDEAVRSPIFEFNQWRNVTRQEFDFLQQVQVIDPQGVSMVPRWSPFPAFRVCGTGGWIQCWHDKARQKWEMIRWLDWAEIVKVHHMEDEFGDAARQFVKNLTGICYMKLESLDEYKWSKATSVYSTGGHTEMINEKAGNALSEMGMDSWKTVCTFICHCALPSTTILQVKPKNGEHKSVKWHQSRTHYCLLTHMQAQRMQTTRKPVTDHDINRAAHWRRAHFRRLNSPRFTYMKSQVRPVKQAWVGPKEWEGSDAKIYRVWDIDKPTGAT